MVVMGFEGVLRRWRRLPPRWREILVAICVPMVLLVSFLSGELILRLEQGRVFGDNSAVETRVASRVWEMHGDRRRPIPGARMGQITYSVDGFRGRDLQQPKPDNLLRIGFFGASTALDIYTETARSWPVVVMDILRARFPGCRFDYFNAGVVGYTLEHARRRILEDSLPFQPDLAVVLMNDLSFRGRRQLGQRGIEVEGYRPGWLAQRSLLWLKLEKNAQLLQWKRVSSRPDTAHRLELAELEGELRRDLVQFVSDVRRAGPLPILVENASRMRRGQGRQLLVENAGTRILYQPGVYVEDILASQILYNRMLADIAGQQDLPFIATESDMAPLRDNFVDSSHLTPEGSQRFGQIVGERLAVTPALAARLGPAGLDCL